MTRSPRRLRAFLSHPVRGAWIEILTRYFAHLDNPSHPVRGAWIEISLLQKFIDEIRSHPVRGAWIEIRAVELTDACVAGRTPSGVRGLKWITN